MTFREIFRLSHREFTAFRTRSRATVITIGALFGLLLGLLFIWQGLENLTLRYARQATGGPIYLASIYHGGDHNFIPQRIQHYGGEIVNLTADQQAQLDTDLPATAIIAKFTSLPAAHNYSDKTDASTFHYNYSSYEISELFSNQVSVYRYFRTQTHNFLRPITITLLVISVFILAFTLAHLLTSSSKTFVLYRSLGASKHQLILIYFAYLLELCARAIIFALLLALALSALATLICWNFLLKRLSLTYPNAPAALPILLGFNLPCLGVLICPFFAAPLSFLLCLDQFSNKRLAQKLKGD